MAKQPRSIIVLSGVSNAGKTTTLKKVIETLTESGCKRLDPNSDNIARPKGDVRIAFTVNGFRVGICTPGDSAEVIGGNFHWAVDLEIDILVTASKSAASSESVEAIVTQALKWNVYPVFLALMTFDKDPDRAYHESETAKRIIAAIQLKTTAL